MVAIFTGANFGMERGSASVLGGVGLLGNAVQGRSGDSVSLNAATGNLLIQKQDEFLVGRGPDASVGRTYNSLTSLGDDNNDKWRQSTDRRVYGLTGTLNAVGSTVKRASGDGTEITYTWDSTRSAYLSRDGGGAYDTIVKSGTEWVWTDGDSRYVERYFDTGAGKIKSVADNVGTTMNFAYDGSNRLTDVTTNEGSWLHYDWGSGGTANNITQIVTGYIDLQTSTAKTLTRTRYDYDGSNRLWKVNVDLTPGDNSVVDGVKYTTTYGYDGSGRVNSITQTDGSSLTFGYDGSSRVTSFVQTTATGVTRTTTITYNAGYTTILDPSSQTTRLDYDANGNLTKITAPPQYSGATQQTLQFAYNANGDLTSSTDARGEITTYASFTTNGLAQTITNRNNDQTTRTFDANNRLLTETRSGVDASGTVSQTSRFIYNTAGDLRFSVSAEGRVTEFIRNAYGMVTSEIAYTELAYSGTYTEAAMSTWASGIADRSWVQRTDYVYDARLNMTKATSYGAASAAGTGVLTHGYTETNFIYSQAGELLSSNATGQAATTYLYDGLGRLKGSTEASGNVLTIVFDDANTKTTITNTSTARTTIKTYNRAGDLIEQYDGGVNVSGGGSIIYTAVDKLGRTRVTTFFGNSDKIYDLYDGAGRHTATIDAAGRITEYRYDANNRLVGTIQYRNLATAPNLTTLNNPDNTLTIANIRPATHAEDTSSWTVYDDEGRVLQTILGDGSTTISSYDASGRLLKTTSYVNKVSTSGFITAAPTAVINPTADAVNDTYVRYFYDKDGLLIGTMSAEKFIVRNTYDQSGQLVASTAYANATTAANWATASFNTLIAGVSLSASRDRTTRYVYDGRGELRFTVDSLSNVQRKDYDTAGLVTRSITYATPISTSDYTYDNLISLLATQDSGGTRRIDHFVYDTAGRLVYKLEQSGNTSTSASAAVTGYTYDVYGNLVRTVAYATLRNTSSLPSKATMDSWVAVNNNAATDRTSRMWYNGRNELKYMVDGEGALSSWSYDIKGRKAGETIYATTVAGSVSDSTTYAQVAALATGTSYLRGWMYDSLDRVTRAYDFSASNYTEYTYHGTTGLVVSEMRAAGGTAQEQSTLNRVYDGAGRVTQSTDAAGVSEDAVTTFAYNGRGLTTSVLDARGTTTKYDYDLSGRIKTVTEAFGVSEQRITAYEYNAFGEAWKVTDPRYNITYSWYDQLGRITHQRDAENYLTTTSYTSFGEIQSVKRWFNAVSGTAAIATPPTVTAHASDATTSFTYDKAGRVLTSVDAKTQTESYSYNAFGDRATVTNRLSLVIDYTYDKAGRVTRESYDMYTVNHDAVGAIVTGNYAVKSYSYDSRGNLKTFIEGYSLTNGGSMTALRTTGYTYDANSRTTQITRDAVTVISDDMVTMSSATPTETYTYDNRGNVIKSVDAGDAQTFSYYDDLDRKIAEVRQLSASTAVYTSYTYDENGNLTSTKVYDGNFTPLPSTPGGAAPAAPAGTYRQTDFIYDRLNRVTVSRIVSNAGNVIASGSWNGSSYVQTTGNLDTSYSLDANNNIIQVTGPNGVLTSSWYDKLNRKTDQLDAEGYLTHWTYDAEGNVLSETRYATKFTGTITLSTPVTVATNAADRTTIYTYDFNGNRVTEKRTGVAAWAVNATSGALSAAGTDAIISYGYNALNQVTSKTVDGSVIAGYVYHASGRLDIEYLAAYTDANGVSVTPTHTYHFDALGDLTQKIQWGATGTYSSADRVINYRYGEGGRLIAMTDAEGNFFNYNYDKAGRLKKESYTRLVNTNSTATSSSTTTVTEAQTKTYDLGGRVLTQSIYSTVGGTFKRVGLTSFQYNNFDQVTQQGVGTNSASDISVGTALYQTANQYDAAGRLSGSNSGDGVWKFFGYDKLGNQTVAVTSAGASFTSSTGLAGALALVSGNTVNATYSVYDKRSQSTQVVEEGRDISAGSTNQTLVTGRTYNAYGEVATETDAELNSITYTYNTMGRLIRSESPAVQITAENGASYWIKPSEDYYYDLGGRRIATRDANGTYATTGTSAGTATTKSANTGNLTTFALLAGSGYDGGAALVSTEFHSDGGKKQTLYDRMGDARVLRSEIFDYANPSTTTQYFEEQYFNKLGQLTQLKHARASVGSGDANRLVDNFVYDQFGQRIQHWNNQYGSGFLDKTAYDGLGRVTSQTDMEGHVVTTSYTWNGTLATSGLTTFGGWEEVTSYVDASLQSTVRSDIFGRETYKSDLGSHVFTTGYDSAGRMTSRTTGATSQTWQWYNTGLLKQSAGLNGTEDYGYDKTGDRTSEILVSGGYTIKDATATYDALGRLTSMNQASTSYYNGGGFYTSPDISNQYAYDAVGNIRQTVATHKTIDYQGAVYTTPVTDTYWFRYDAMNRLVVDRGVLSGAAGAGGTTIVRGYAQQGMPTQGQNIEYDYAGQRKHVIRTEYSPGSYLPPEYGGTYIPGYYQEVRENYEYYGDGTLGAIRITAGTAASEVYNGSTGLYDPPSSLPAAAVGGGPMMSYFTYDLVGRQVSQTDYASDGTTVLHSRSSTYNKIGQVTGDTDSQKKYDSQTYVTTSTYSFSNGGTYILGSVYQVDANNIVYNSGGGVVSNKNSLTTNAYQWYDGASQGTVTYDSDTGSGSNPIYTTSFYNDTFGQLYQVNIADGRPRDVYFRNDGSGQVIRRDEVDGNGSNGDPHEVWYRFNGRELGYLGNNGTSDLNAPNSIADRQQVAQTGGAFRNGQVSSFSYADFAVSYDPLNTYGQGSAAGGYQVQQTGESLRSIAQALWGDASLWYKLADANGLMADTTLIEGQRLVVPAGVVRSSHNADTLKPYDANEAIGNVSPTTPKPAKKNKCGVFGQILLAAVAIAVVAIAPTSIPALNAALGSIASQTLGVATGIQQKFSFKNVAMAAIGADVGASLGGIGGSGVVGDVIRGAVGSAVTQGIGVATGLQSKFSWAGVAAGAIGTGVGGAVSRGLASGNGIMGIKAEAGSFANGGITATATVLANAATRSAISGTNFGDNIMRALPDAIGALVVQTVGGALSSRREPPSYQFNGGDGESTAGDAGVGSTQQSGVTIGDAAEAAVSALAISKSRSGSGVDVRGGEIVVEADPVMHFLLTGMSDWQFSLYYGRAGEHTAGRFARDTAFWASAQDEPIKFSSYDSPLIQSFRSPPSPFGAGSGMSISSYKPRVLEDVRIRFTDITAPGYALRDNAYSDFSAGWPLLGASKYVGSLGLRTLETVDLGVELSVSAARGHGFRPTPLDRQDAGLLSMLAGGVGGFKAIGRRAAEGSISEINVLFGQKRVGPTFGVEGRPEYLAGRTISDVADDLRLGVLHPDQLPINAFKYGDDFVSANTRSLAALSEAGLRPTVVNEIQPTNALLRRLREAPIMSNAPLPGPRVPVTPSQKTLDILHIIELAK